MDAEITALESRLTKTKSIKQGMMQQLLTGRTRLVWVRATEERHEWLDKTPLEDILTSMRQSREDDEAHYDEIIN